MKQFLKYLHVFLSLLSLGPLFSQNIDSLEKALPSLSGAGKARALNDLGYYTAFSNPKKAIVYSVRAIALASELRDSLLLAACMNDGALSYFYKGHFDSCIILSEQAGGIRQRYKKWRDAGASFSKAALGYYEKGDYDKSLEKNLEALSYLKKGNAFLEVAKLQNNIGSIYERNNQLEEAKKMYDESARICLEQKDYEGYLTAKSNFAIIYQKTGKLSEASKILTELIPICRQHCRSEYLSEIYQALGVSERGLGHTEAGLGYYLKAKQIYDSIGSLNGMSVININIANCYIKLKQVKLAEEYLQLGLKQAQEIKSLLWQRDAYNSLYEVEKLNGDYKKANEYLLRYQMMNDSIYNEKTQQQLSHLQTQYNLQQKENTILMQKSVIAEKELLISKRNVSVIILVALLLVSVLLSIFIFQRINIRRKQAALEFQRKIQHERSRIAKDLHDNMGAELTIINSAIDVLAYSLGDNAEKAELDSISDQVRKASALMRDTIWTVSEEKISMVQFGIKVKEFAERTLKLKNMRVHFQNTASDDNLRPEATLHLFRIVQEVINNAAKHSEAKNFYIDNFSSKPLTIVLKDDGKGYDVAEIERGYGLNNMASRAADMGAQISTAAVAGEHTTVTVTIGSNAVWKA